MKVLVLGGGGREHALVWKLRQSARVSQLYCAPGNGGIAEEAECLPVDLKSLESIVALGTQLRPDLTIVGPELPLTLGVVDEFTRRGWPVFGPTKAASQLEWSKSFAKEFLQRYHIPTAPYAICDSVEEVREAMPLVGHRRREIVLEVVLGVVHADVVREVGLGGLAEEGTEHPRDVVVHPRPGLLEERPVAGVVEHEDEAVEEEERDHRQVDEAEPPAEHPGDVEGDPEGRDGEGDDRHQHQEGAVAGVVDERGGQVAPRGGCWAGNHGRHIPRLRNGL